MSPVLLFPLIIGALLAGRMWGIWEQARRVRALEDALRASEKLLRYVDAENQVLRAKQAFHNSIQKMRIGS